MALIFNHLHHQHIQKMTYIAIRIRLILLVFAWLPVISGSTATSINSLNIAVDDCEYEDGRHGATVSYTNPDTGHSATYSLDVEVDDCEVTVIYFPKGGWLDDSHISSGELDDDGYTVVSDQEGRTFEVQLD